MSDTPGRDDPPQNEVPKTHDHAESAHLSVCCQAEFSPASQAIAQSWLAEIAQVELAKKRAPSTYSEERVEKRLDAADARYDAQLNQRHDEKAKLRERKESMEFEGEDSPGEPQSKRTRTSGRASNRSQSVQSQNKTPGGQKPHSWSTKGSLKHRVMVPPSMPSTSLVPFACW